MNIISLNYNLFVLALIVFDIFFVRKISAVFILSSIPCIILIALEWFIFYKTGFKPIPVKTLLIYNIFLYIANLGIFYLFFRIVRQYKERRYIISNQSFKNINETLLQPSDHIPQNYSKEKDLFRLSILMIPITKLATYIELIGNFLAEILNGNQHAKLTEDYFRIIISIMLTMLFVGLYDVFSHHTKPEVKN